MSPALHIASLGSSFAAGPGILQPSGPPMAMRSSANYAHLLAHMLDAQLTDCSISGSTLLNIVSDPQRVWKEEFPPQIDALPHDADVVLVLSGGNDLGYGGGLLHDSVGAYWIGRLITRVWQFLGCPGRIGPATAVEATVVAQRYGEVLDAIHTKAPAALVLVLDYLTVLGPAVKPGVDLPLSCDLVEYHRGVAEKLEHLTANACLGREGWCRHVAIAQASREHGVGSSQPWVTAFVVDPRVTPSYHPTAAGMRAVAEILQTEIHEKGHLPVKQILK